MMLTCLIAVFLFQDSPASLASGGSLSLGQAAVDMRHLDLALKVDPEKKTISGTAALRFQVAQSLDVLELDLVSSLTVEEVAMDGRPLSFQREGHRILIALPKPCPNPATVNITYAGQPREAVRPPWSGGFNWSRTDGGKPWVGVSCQGQGGKLWFPCKAHLSDKFEGARLAITVPEGLYCAANGLLQQIEPAQDGWRTFIWETKYPISTYNLSLNIADYEVIERTYHGSRDMPVILYALKEYQKSDQVAADGRSYDQKKSALLDSAVEYLGFFARYYGEYPFIEEKFGIAHTHYLGMEHQTINSYGNHFKIADDHDFLLFHEMGHEWWGNKVSVADWGDFWIHEGICTYTTMVYLEDRFGLERAVKYMTTLRHSIANRTPLIPRKHATSDEVYNLDVYYKGALVMHALRFLVGKATLDHILRTLTRTPRLTYQPVMDTRRFIRLSETLSDMDLGWFFQTYLYRAALPRLQVVRGETSLELAWEPADFAMPLELALKNGAVWETRRVDFIQGKARIQMDRRAIFEIDPNDWVLKEVVEDKP